MSIYSSKEDLPRNTGKAWEDTEVGQLLQEIHKKVSLEEIAKIHERTLGGIRSRLRVVACDYYDEGRSLEEIQKFTGLDITTIQAAIQKRKIARQPKKESPPIQSPPSQEEDTLSVLKDIRSLLEQLVKNTQPK